MPSAECEVDLISEDGSPAVLAVISEDLDHAESLKLQERNQALLRLEDRDPLKRIVSLLTLRRVAQPGDEHAVGMICTASEDEDSRVRREAMLTLCVLAST